MRPFKFYPAGQEGLNSSVAIHGDGFVAGACYYGDASEWFVWTLLVVLVVAELWLL